MHSNETSVVPVRSPQDEFGPLVALVLNAVESRHTKTAYKKALTDFLSWYRTTAAGAPFNKSLVQAWVQKLREEGLSSSTINQRLSAVRKLATEGADNGYLSSDNAQAIQRVKGVKASGTRTGNWLNLHQAEQLVNAPDTGMLKGQRDRAILALLIGAGLRRSEVSALTFAQIQQREGRWAIVDLRGKGNRIRTVPMPSWAKVAIDQWAVAAGIREGHVFRPMNNRHELTRDRLLEQNIMELVTRYGQQIGVPKLAPHDLRRTFAKLAHKGRAPLEQIQLSLGHATILTTERYLGVRQDLTDAPCDHLGLRLSA
jgi:site-specific recombinase XerD